MDKFLIVDGNSIANRAFYALPFLSNHEGKPSGAVFGFANILIKIIQQEKPTHILIAFDHARKTFRNELYSEYKMQRKPTPEELILQFPIIKDMLSSMKIKVIESAGIEADDIIGTASKIYNGFKIVLSGDRDLLQLIDNNTEVWLTKKGVSEIEKVNNENISHLFGIRPEQIIDLKALMGDSSDNIPGVKGVGEKTALTLLNQYDNIENVYQNLQNIKGKLREKLEEDKDMAFLSKQLATIKRDCKIDFNIDECMIKFPFDKDTFEFFKNWDFTSLIKNPNLFENLNINDVKKEKIEEKQIDENWINQIKNLKPTYLSYNLKNMKFYINNHIFYLEQNYDMFKSPISLEDVCLALKNIFEDNEILKITENAKDDLHILKKFDIKLNNFYDLDVANYLIEAGNKIVKHEINLSEYYELMEKYNKEIRDNKLSYVYENIEKPLINILFEMEENGFKINEERLDLLLEEFNNKINDLTKEIYIEADEEFNINSPKQVANILFEKLGIKAYNNKKQSTSADVLDELRYIPIVNNILTYRKYNKLKNTYLEVYKNLCETQGNIIHTTFNQTLTSTGRLSSSEPNLQNIPTRDDEGKNLRKIFVSKFKDGKIISADYNQIELRLLADMSGEEKLIESYKQGEDIHKITASHIFGVDLNDVTPAQRRDAKAVNFGIIYGISDYGLSQNIKSSRAKAKDYINSYFLRYPKVKEFMDNNISFAKENGFATTKFGRIRKIPEISSSKYNIRTFGERVAMNMPLQGTASDIIKLAMIKVFNALKKEDLKSQLILQIHDELIIDTFPGEEEKVKKILKREMENVVTLKVPLIVSIGVGESLFECK